MDGAIDHYVIISMDGQDDDDVEGMVICYSYCMAQSDPISLAILEAI